MRISDWSSDVCSSDLRLRCERRTDGIRDEPAGELTHRHCLYCRHPGRRIDHRQTERTPGRESTIEHRDASMTRGAQQPPQSRREQAIALIVGDDMRIVVYAPGREALRERGRLRQRMAAAGGGDRTGQVVVEEIGRESCRERECPYVWITVVAVSFKKKTKSPNMVLTQQK